jgi:hypothetical protein
MAESDHRSHRDPGAPRSASTGRAQSDDPLAELARLIGQSLPMSDFGSDSRRQIAAANRSTREFDSLRQHDSAVPDELSADGIEEQYPPHESGDYAQDLDRQNDPRDDRQYEPSIRADRSRLSRSSWFRRESQSDPNEEDPQVPAPAAGYDDYDHDAPDQTYDEDYEEDSIPRRRGGFIFVAAVFGLAVLGTAGAFAYRAMFSESMVPSLPPIIKAESGPTKIIPNGAPSKGGVAQEGNAANTGSGERLVSREEQPVEVPPAASSAPRPVSTVPIFPDPTPPPGVGGASIFPPSPVGQPTPAARVDGPSVPPTAPSPAPTPASSANQAAAPAVPPPTPAPPGPKKIRTVSIRTDQSSPDSSPSQAAARQQGAKGAADPNGPLSIIPSSDDAAPVAAGHARNVPPRPAPVSKPAATEATSDTPIATASTGPVAPSGNYSVQVSSQRSEEEAQSAFRALQVKYPNVLGGREATVRRADLGAKGIYYRAMVGPFTSADQASELCSNLKAAGGSCIVQKN